MLSQNVAKGIQQVLESAARLLEIYVETKDDSLVPILQGLLSATTVALSDTASMETANGFTRSNFPFGSVEAPFFSRPFSLPQDQTQPDLSPSIVWLYAGPPMSYSSYDLAVEPSLTVSSKKKD